MENYKDFLNDIQNSDGLILLIDIDDLISFSSNSLQKVINEKTCFKTDVLHMLEQLKRNCQYYVECIKEECDLALKENRSPNFFIYHIFDDMKFSEDEQYTKPVEIIKEYYKAANKIYNQFLEERDTFLEIDNLPKGRIIPYDYAKEALSIIEYAELIKKYRKGFHIINKLCYDIVRIRANIAEKNNTLPDYESIINMDANDIIKENGKDKEESIEEYLYEKPVKAVEDCLNLEDRIDDIISNARVFFEPSKEIVDYSKIHGIENVNWKAINFIRKILATNLFDAAFFASHNTGPREDAFKGYFYPNLMPEVNGYFGKRFHTEEHDAERRDRSSKIDYVAECLGVDKSRIVLIDDSIANCRDCKEKGGIALLYKAMTDSEKINRRLIETGFYRVLDLENNDACEYLIEENNKRKGRAIKKI